MSSTILSRPTLLGLGVALLGAGCGDGETDDPRSQGAPTITTSVPAPAAGPTPDQESSMSIQVTIGDQRFRATLSESAATRDLLAQLPLTIDMSDHGGVEKTGPLPAPLSLEGQPDGADPDEGDVGYYAPGSDLVLYYGDQSHYPGIVILGQLEGDAAQRISDLGGPVTATVERQGA